MKKGANTMEEYIKYLEQTKKWISNPNLDEKVKEELPFVNAVEKIEIQKKEQLIKAKTFELSTEL